MSIQVRPDGRIFVRFRDENGKQHSKPFGRGEQAMKEAEAHDGHLEADRKIGKRPSGLQGMHFGELFKTYLADRKANGASKSYTDELKSWFNNTLSNEEKPLRKVLDKAVDNLKYSDMMKVMDYYQDRTQATRNRYLGYLRAVFRFGLRHGLITKNPLQSWQRVKEEPRRSQLTVEDLALIMECAPCHLRWALEVEYALGTRPGPSELLSLKWENVNFREDYIEVYAHKTKTWRQVPISPAFKNRLFARKAKAKTDYIIEYQDPTKKISDDEYEVRRVNKLHRSFRTACNNAGINYPCEMYDVRHLFARSMLNNGADLAAVSRLMGHASVKMTADVYYNVQEGEKRRAISLLPTLPTEEPRLQKKDPQNGGSIQTVEQSVEQAF